MNEIEDGMGFSGLVPTKEEKYVNKLEQQLQKALEHNKILIGALEFYADDSNWEEVRPFSGFYIVPKNEDIEDNHFCAYNHCAGKIAREALAKVKDND